jgi:hypothetical protein
MADKEFVNIKSDFVMKDSRIFRRKLDDWERKAKAEGIPICLTCAHFDFQHDQLVDDWTKYTIKNTGFFTKINESKTIEDRLGGRRLVQYMIEWKCKRNHKRTDVYPEEVYNELFKKGKDEKLVKTKVKDE